LHRPLLLGALLAAPLVAQQSPTDTTKKPVPLAAVTITATRTARSTFDTPQPITVIDSTQIQSKVPANPIELFTDVPGLDASGVGPNQRRPEIRGQRGQRVLLLQDGLRLNNERREQDFGEIPALAGISSDQRIEVVRGPSSVLYGTDAIGGVVNIISPGVPATLATGDVRGGFTYRYGSVGTSSTPTGNLMTRVGRLGVRANFATRNASDYKSPSGTFGDVTLDSSVTIHDSGVRDHSGQLLLDYDLGGPGAGNVFARGDFYSADDAGFGYVDPASYAPGSPTIQILYPDQDYNRVTLGYRADALSTAFAHRAEVSVYTQRNKRHLAQNIFVPAGPGASVLTNAFNYTNLATVGGRLELARGFGVNNTFTYGVDAFRDRSNNTDSSVTTLTGFGPPPPLVFTSNTPNVPNAAFTSTGAFAQLESRPLSRLTTILGVRGQHIKAETRATPGISAPLEQGTNNTVVWSANGLYRIADGLNGVVAVGRGFRAANLIERFFQGPAPEGNGYQQSNPELGPERSINVDLGLRARRGIFYGEGFVFRNDVNDAIRAVATGDTVQGQPAFQDRNVGRLRVDGLELTAGATPLEVVNASLSWSRLLGKNVSDPGNPIGDTYSSKVVGDVSYQPINRLTLGYTARYQGKQKDVIIGQNPIGPVIPAFTVHSARAMVQLFDRNGVHNTLALSVNNIGNRLYAEFPNASFFRPEPGRSVAVAIYSEF
jgi:hemoglobin/transferrin/lactoferrin receptor protein